MNRMKPLRPRHLFSGGTRAVLATIAMTTAAAHGGGVDLQLDNIRVSQAIRFGNSPLVAGNVTFVRALISTPGFGGSVDDVDAELHLFVDGVEAEFSPIYSMNGPITSPTSPNEMDLNDHVNFWFIAPESSDVDIEIIVNPFGTVDESNLDNNTGSVNNLNFQCRDIVELVYVPINYIPNGGPPDEDLIEPGIGDAFVRAIFKPLEWDYHRSPLGNLNWSQNINGSSSSLLNTLHNIRVFSLPSNGYPAPTFIYGWLPGNPFSGNGQANGIPGDAAFGNTQTSRHQRTFAHELGHLLDEPHNGENVGQVGIDVEHHLDDTEGLPVLHSSGQNDIMVAGQLTSTAFVSNPTYINTNTDSRMICNAPFAPEVQGALLSITGVMDHDNGTLFLDPIHTVARGVASADRPQGIAWLIARGANGAELARLRVADGSSRERCDGEGNHSTSPMAAMVPETINGVRVTGVEVVRIANGAMLAQRERSANAPQARFLGHTSLGANKVADLNEFQTGTVLTGEVELRWTASDADGDDLSYFLMYTHDAGATWMPLGVNLTEPSFSFHMDNIAATSGDVRGIIRLLVSDGFNQSEFDSPMMEFAGASAPELYFLTPNGASVYSQHGMVIFHAYAWDKEDAMISDNITWTSSINGAIGSGGLLQTADLSPGIHTIIASVVDSDGQAALKTILMGIEARDIPSGTPDPDLDGDGSVGFSDLLILLGSWGVCPGCPADLDESGDVGFSDLLIILSAWD